MKVLEKYLKTHLEEITLILEQPGRKYTPATFHKLRIEIKKLKALFDLINYCSGDFNLKKTIKPFNQIFRQAGKLRELQVEEAMLKNHFNNNSFKSYKKMLAINRINEENVFFSIVNKNLIDKLKTKYDKIISSLEKVHKKKANKYLVKKEEAIKILLNQPTIQVKRLHEIRRRLKMLNYNRQSMREKKENKLNTNKDVLTQLLGKWHDGQTIINHLKKTISVGRINSIELKALEKFKKQLAMENQVLYDKILALIWKGELFIGH